MAIVNNECCLFNTQLGHYDSKSVTIFLNRHSTQLAYLITECHESMHQALAEGSTYGKLLIRGARDLHGPDRSRILSALTNACRATQEGLATYASLLVNRSEDYVNDLPVFYRETYGRFKKLVEHCAATTYLRLLTALAIARSAMMIPFGMEVEDLISTDTLAVPSEYSPDSRLERIEAVISSLPQEHISFELSKYFSADIWSRIEREEGLHLLGKNQEERDDLHDRMNHCLMQVFDEVLAGTLPKIAKTYRMSLFLPVGRWARHAATLGVHPSVIENMWQLANQTVAIDLRTAPPVAVSPFFRLPSLLLSSLSRTGRIHIKAEYDSVNGRAVYYLMDVRLSSGAITVEACQMEEMHLLDFGVNPYLIVTTLDEFDDIYEKSSPRWRTLLDSCTLFHMDRNPVEFLMDALSSGHAIEWNATRLDYRDGTVRADQQADLLLYAVGGLEAPGFHLSNPMMTRAVRQLTNHAGSNSQLNMREAPSGGSDRFVELLASLADHPFFYCWVLLGKKLRLLEHDELAHRKAH
ncbi:hypothetical protein [Streptomyces olivaceiscleroticus]|uniref:Uncharacterized protein n=1 Tax=Streptomyces olivaceiscleroticus TaxID=68245 RepID=A0ABP3KBE0_9ACTN